MVALSRVWTLKRIVFSVAVMSRTPVTKRERMLIEAVVVTAQMLLTVPSALHSFKICETKKNTEGLRRRRLLLQVKMCTKSAL